MPSPRKWFSILLVVLACLSVALAATYMASGRNPRNSDAAARVVPDNAPDVVFAPGVTSGRQDVDAFIHRFITLCRENDYEQYRLCWTAYGMPISRDRFNKLYGFARKITITEIMPLPGRDEQDHPSYLIRARAELANPSVPYKDVDLMVRWEENRWAIAPAPSRDGVTDTAPASRSATGPEAAAER